MEGENAIVFISYASPDRMRVLPVAQRLVTRGLNVWMDYLCLKPGQNWDFEIKRALDRAAIVIVFVSHNSVNRRGYVQREIKFALDKAQEKLLGDIYVIPVMLEGGLDYPDELKKWHAVHLDDPGSEEAVAAAIQQQFKTLSVESEAAQARAGFRWHRNIGRESWDGLPGYDIEWSSYALTSLEYPELEDVNAVIEGSIAQMKMQMRRTKLEQEPSYHSFGKARELRTSALDIQFAEPVIQERVVSLLCAKHYYFSGAAHGNTGFESWVFLVTPLIQLRRLEDAFRDPTKAIDVIRQETRRILLSHKEIEGEDYVPVLEEEWVNRGTEDWSAFQVFRFLQNGLEITFSPYEVACYAAGPQTVVLPWELIVSLMNGDYIDAAGLNYIAQ